MIKKEKSRNAKILHDMPEIMDLLVVSVEAGLGLDAAITRLFEKNHSPLLMELMKTVRDAQMGLPRRESLKAMGERCNVQELRAFAAAFAAGTDLQRLGRSHHKRLIITAGAISRKNRGRNVPGICEPGVLPVVFIHGRWNDSGTKSG